MLDIIVIACGVIAGTLIARKIEQRKSKKNFLSKNKKAILEKLIR